jgi:uncharacterized membrane protein YhaH (DUF805 family)
LALGPRLRGDERIKRIDSASWDSSKQSERKMNADIGSLLFSFRRRINRAKYWLALVIYFAVDIVIVLFGTAMAVFGSIALWLVVFAILVLPMLISACAVGIKRLHDRHKSGWWLLLFYLLPILFDGLAPIHRASIRLQSRQRPHRSLGACRTGIPARHARTEPIRPRPAWNSVNNSRAGVQRPRVLYYADTV